MAPRRKPAAASRAHPKGRRRIVKVGAETAYQMGKWTASHLLGIGFWAPGKQFLGQGFYQGSTVTFFAEVETCQREAQGLFLRAVPKGTSHPGLKEAAQSLALHMGSPTFSIHMCPPHCPRAYQEDLLHAALVTRRLGEEAWHTNLSVAGVGPLDDAARDENASLRQLKEQQGDEMEKEQALLDEGRGAGVKDGEKKRKERKEGRCKRSTSSEGHKADSKKGRKIKTLKVCFKGTGLDPTRSLRKLLKKAKCQREGAKRRHSSSESSSNSSRSRGSSSSRAFEGGELAERVARAAPGALTRETLRVMKDVIGKVLEAPPEQGRTLVPLYHRYFPARMSLGEWS